MTPRRPAFRSIAILAATCLVAAGCAVGTPTGPDADKGGGTKRTNTKGSPEPTGSPDAKASPGVVPPTASPDPAKGYFGRVLGLDGNPAAGVRIEARIIANHGGSLITDNGAGLITDNGAGLIANNSGSYRLKAGEEILTATSGADGTFALAIPAGQKANVEAIQATDVKAIRGSVTADGGGFDLKLAPTGTIKGKVTTPPDRQISNYLGVDVYIPGTSYIAKADAAGNFQIDNVPVGGYKLFAEKVGLGSGVSSAVDVKSREAAQVGELVLQVEPVTITAIEPPFAFPGSQVKITGTRFGKSSGSIFKLRLGGVVVENATVVSDTEATFTVPKNATGGELVVDVNGMQSAPTPFPAINSFDVSAPIDDIGVGAVYKSRVTAYDLDYEVIKDVALPIAWKVVAGDAVTVDQTGAITAVKLGTARVEAVFGGHRAVFPVVVSATATAAGSLGGLTLKAASNLSGAIVLGDGQRFVTSGGRVFRLAADGKLETLAGAGSGEEPRDDVGKAARFEGITAFGRDDAGRLLVGDSVRVRVVAAGDGAVTTLAGSLSWDDFADEPVDATGPAARMVGVTHVAGAKDGVVFFLDQGALRRIDAGGAVTSMDDPTLYTALGSGPDGTAYATVGKTIHRLDQAGEISLVGTPGADGTWPSVTGQATKALAADALGNLYIAYDTLVLRVDHLDRKVSILAGSAASTQVDAATGAAARFSKITSLAWSAAGNKLLVVESNAVREIALDDAAHPVTTIVHGDVGSEDVPAEPIDGGDPDEEEEADLADDEVF